MIPNPLDSKSHYERAWTTPSFVLAVLLAILPCLYVLSVGPAIAIARPRPFAAGDPYADPDLFDRFYGPLLRLSGKSKITHDTLDWYIRLWRP